MMAESMTNAPVEEELERTEIEERRALIDRVAASSYFQRSARLRDFLLYIGGQSLKEGCPEIHEQEVGAHVFGRPINYDRSQDNIVRVNATELRKRIDAYFAAEGAHEALIMEVPRGGYKPVFRRRLPIEQQALASSIGLPSKVAVPSPEPAIAARHSSRGFIHVLWATPCLLLALLCGLLLHQNRAIRKDASPWDGKPALAAFWSDFLEDHQQTDIVLPDDSFSVIQDLTQHPVSLEDYLNREYMRQIQSSNISADRKLDLDQIFAHNLITFGGVRAAQQVLAQITGSPTPHLTLSRYYTADAMKKNNIVLVGGKKANPWVHLFDSQMNFVTDYDYVQGHAVVVNLHPRPGEQSLYVVPRYPDSLIGYTVVTYLPGPSRTGKAIILAGTDSDATTAASEFLTSEDQLERFRNTLHVQKFPYFEVLLKTSRLSGTSFSAEVVAYRTYPGLR
jgi:hypothetical protein